MGTHHTHLVNEDDDDEDAEDEDVYMYPTDMHPDERDAYRYAVHASKPSDWEREQHKNIVGSKRKPGESSTARQKNIKDIFKGGVIKETMGRLIRKFFIYESVAPVKAKSHHFKNMIIGVQQVGMGIEPPSPYEIKNKYLEMEYKEMEAYVNQQREKWKTYGGTIMSDGWTGPTKLIVPTRPFVYELMHVMKENLIRQGAGDWMFKIIQDRWEKTLKHPLHAAAEWWFMYGNQTPTLRKLVIKVLSQTVSSSAYERNWSTFALIHTKQRNRLAYPRLEQLVFCYYNMRLKLCDMETENDRVAEKDYLDLLDISAEAALNSHQEIDSTSADHNSRPSAAGTSASSYDGSRSGTDDGDHDSRRVGPDIGAIGKPYRGRERMMEPYNEELLLGSFEFMSIDTQFSDSSNEANVYPPHVMSYGQPSSSTDEEYGMSRYSPSRKMLYQVPYQMEGRFDINTWVNFDYPIHVEAVGKTQEIYAQHVRIFNQYY
ncbi:hypothetical protein CK203_079132 [Vitis vinifera]|uniref:HAT C-terminal dimerisation domain-containing protein n=1 Tax=Vitis vinifera TaxID=29760 RepID=A0A438DYL1_VITVI|nr:hypothetical protein CK203_079132 [Vitis vinifera]